MFGLSSTQFFALNPEVKADCTNLGLGEAYCVKAIGQPSGGNGTIVPPANVVLGTDTQVRAHANMSNLIVADEPLARH
jgi:hypothetical protein